jgi:hypothetical protein
LSLATKAALYLRLRHALARLAQTDQDERLIWSVIEYFSSGGNALVISKIFIAASTAF